MSIAKTLARSASAAALAAAVLVPTLAVAQVGVGGRQLDVIGAEVTPVNVPSVGDLEFGQRPIVGIRWDPRCAAVDYTFNSNRGANPGTGAEIPPEALAAAVQDGLDRWNGNPSSYIEMNITSLTDLGDRPRQGLDFINEVTFITAEGFGALASSPSTSLTADANFVAGDDIDGDGDSDVFDPELEGRNTCGDVDGDGDIEFPAGFYEAGTILDNDVQFGSGVFWELGATDGGGADVDAVSTHEFGHSHGISHALNNQTSEEDGTGTTMFPFIATNESISELATREPHPDDFAQSAFLYPEGSEDSGPGALQEGDVAFADAYHVVTGTVTGPDREPVGGANVRIVDFRSGELLTEAFSGTTVVFQDINGFVNGGLFAFEEAILDGDYRVPVPKRFDRTTAEIQATDGSPAAASRISTNVNVANIARTIDFVTENYSGTRENLVEANGDQKRPLNARQLGNTRAIEQGRAAQQPVNFIVDDAAVLRNAGDIDFVGTGAVIGQTQIAYAERFGGQALLAALEDSLLTSFAFDGNVIPAFDVPMFDRAALVLGTVDENGVLSVVGNPLVEETDFVTEDDDLTSIPVNALRFERRLEGALRRNPDADVFILVETDSADLTANGFPDAFMRLDVGTAGTSYLGLGGDAPSLFTTGTFAMELRLTPKP